jgi:hypothetical protein
VRGAGFAEQFAGGFGVQQRLQLRERGVDHLLCFGSLSAFSESSCKNACVFPMISNAALLGQVSRQAFVLPA